MKIEYNNLYTHFVFTTLHRVPIIPEKNRNRIEKYIKGIANNNLSKLYAIYANPEHHRKMSFVEEYDLFTQHYQQNLGKNKVIRF